MSDIICPVCGKTNPDTAETCYFCGTELKPEVARPDTPAVPAADKPGSTPTLDLLAGLSQLGGEDEEETPDWLKNLQSSLPAAPQPEPEPDPEEEPSDQLESPGEQDAGFTVRPAAFQFDDTSEPESTPAEAAPDWLNALKAQDEVINSAPQAETPAPESGADPSIYTDLPDWLAALTGSTSTPAPAQPASEHPEQQPVPANDTPGWFEDLGGDFINAEEPDSAVEQAAPADAESPDWQAKMGADATAESTPADNAPVSNLPDWLASLQAMDKAPETPANPPEPPDVPGVSPSGDLPDWISSLQPTDQAPETPVNLPETSEIPGVSPSGDLPDWMSSLPPADQTPETPVTPPETPAEQPLPEPRPFDTASLGEMTTIAAGSELPDWIASLGQSAQTTPGAAQEQSDMPNAPETPGAALPEAVESAEVVEPQIEARGEASASQPVEAVPAEPSQSELESPVPTSVGEQNIDSILSMDTPDWLSGFAPAESEPAAAPFMDTPSDVDLPAGELPSWVQAMRPMESVLAGAADSGEEQAVENQGPLAGLHSVLPTNPGLVGARTPQAFSTGLLTTETQQAQAALLKNLLNSENTPQEFSKKSETALNRPLRWVIAAVLLIAIGVAAAFGSRVFPAPALPAETSPVGLFITTVKALPDGAPVLVVMDYQPGFAGELEFAAGPVMEQLMGKKARLAFISTSPLGGLLADRLLQKYASTYPYQAGVQYVNLGYLPGGAGGIRAFAEQPRSTLGRDTLSGNLWDTPALDGVTINSETSLSNFSAVIVATDNADTARLWIEQAQPALKQKPMLMVVSAQAEPMMRPYLLSKQLNGLVAGLEGGMLYETALEKPGQARANWDAFGVGVLVSVFLILTGGVWNLISGLRARRTTMEQDEA